MTNRRQFIKRGLLYIPSVSIFVPKLAQAQAQTGPYLQHRRKAFRSGGGSGITWVQDDGATFDPFNSARSVTFGSSTASGNAIIAIYQGSNTGSLVVTDNKSNTYSIHVDGSVSGIVIASALNIAGGSSHQVTFTVTSHSNPARIIVLEYSGMKTSAAFDVGDQETGFVANSSITLTTAEAGELLLGVMNSGSGSVTAGSGFTLKHIQDFLTTEDKIATASGANNVDFVHSERTAQISAAAFKKQ